MPQPKGGHRSGRSLRVSAGRAASAAVLLAGGLLAGGLIGGGPASAQTLTEAFAYAYNNNPQLLAQRAALRATDEQVPQALSNWRPTVTFTGQGGFTRAGAAIAGTPTQFSSFPTRSI